MLKQLQIIGFLAGVAMLFAFARFYGEAQYAKGYAKAEVVCAEGKTKAVEHGADIAKKVRRKVEVMPNSDIDDGLNRLGILRPDNQL